MQVKRRTTLKLDEKQPPGIFHCRPLYWTVYTEKGKINIEDQLEEMTTNHNPIQSPALNNITQVSVKSFGVFRNKQSANRSMQLASMEATRIRDFIL